MVIRAIKICLNCEKEFSPSYSISKSRWEERKFCSWKCQQIYRGKQNRKKFATDVLDLSINKGLSNIKISKKLKIHQRTVSETLKDNGIVYKEHYLTRHPEKSAFYGKPRTLESRQKMSKTRKESPNNKKEKHGRWKGGLPKCQFCGKILSCYSAKTCNICIGKAQLGKNNPNFGKGSFGKANGNYIDGRTSLVYSLRRLSKYSLWRISVFERDNYTCQECGHHGGDLEVHHIKAFSIVFSEFLKEYDQFSPIEDKETLLRLALKYEPFWEVSNGKTLCEPCHDLETVYYLKLK